MTQPLHYTPKAIECLANIPWTGMPGCAAGCDYLISKLRQAQVFVLNDHGELLDRSRPRPEVAGLLFKPPFDVVALEYTAVAVRRQDPFYTAARSSKRIALAWNWTDDMPQGFGSFPELGPGVAIASISFMDREQAWFPMSGIIHMAYNAEWASAANFPSRFRDTMIANGHYARKPNGERSYPVSAIPIMFEALNQAQRLLGSATAVLDTIHADLADEVNAYLDLCYALACKNVTTREHAAPAALNRQRIKSGKLPLMGFHVLELAGAEMPGAAKASGDRAAARSHLRRGHIRRLDEQRVTWVNSTIVRGRGFVDKVYAA